MHSALEDEIRGRLTSLAFRIRQYDSGVVLAIALCFTPFPPAMLIGLILSVSHLAFARRKLSNSEAPLLGVGILVAAGYIALWTIGIYWLARAGALPAMLDLATQWATWFLRIIEPGFWHHTLSAPPPLLRHA